jgi:hypothetical protein
MWCTKGYSAAAELGLRFGVSGKFLGAHQHNAGGPGSSKKSQTALSAQVAVARMPRSCPARQPPALAASLALLARRRAVCRPCLRRQLLRPPLSRFPVLRVTLLHRLRHPGRGGAVRAHRAQRADHLPLAGIQRILRHVLAQAIVEGLQGSAGQTAAWQGVCGMPGAVGCGGRGRRRRGGRAGRSAVASNMGEYTKKGTR